MENPKIKTEVKLSKTNTAYNITGIIIGSKYKIAGVPFIVTGNEIIDITEKSEALKHAEFISFCFNHSEQIINYFNK